MTTSSSRQDISAGSHSTWPQAALAAVVILCVYLFFAGRTTLWDRDEPWYARATVEMIESGNYLYTTFNGRLFLDKPILVYWLMSLPVGLLGPTELAFRFFSAVGTVATCLLTWHVGCRLFGPRAGLWAMLVLASTLLVLIVGNLAIMDAVMMSFIVGALACFVASVCRGVRAAHLVGLALLTGLAMLAKGPMGLVPLIVIVAAVVLGRRALPLGRRYVLYCLLATLGGGAIFCAWFMSANEATGGEMFRQGIGRHVLGRMSRPMAQHGGNFLLYLPYYLPVVVLGFFPWVLHLPGAISATIGGRLGGPTGRAVLLAMILPVFVGMSLVATKLPHYVLAIWPGLALGVGATIRAWQKGQLAQRDLIWLRRGVWLFGPIGMLVGLAMMVASFLAPVPGFRLCGTVTAAVLLATTFAAVWAHRTRGPAVSGAVLLAGMLLTALAVNVLVAPEIEKVKIVPPIARRIRRITPPEVPVATYGFDEPSLNFYLRRPVRSFRDERATPRQVLDWLRRRRDGVLVLTSQAMRSLEAAGPVDAEVVTTKIGLDYSKMRRLDLLVLRRRRGGATSAPK